MNLPYEVQGYCCLPGQPLPLGVSYVIGGLNFAIASQHAAGCSLVLFDAGSKHPKAEIPIPPEFKVGAVFAITILDLDKHPEQIEYGFRLTDANGHDTPILLDPTARAISGRDMWAGKWPDYNDPYPYRARVVSGIFDWEGDHPPNIPREDLIIYEMHVRGFTRHPSSGVQNPGTYDGLCDRIDYLKALGVNAVELMPILEFDEFERWEKDAKTGQLYLNYWGYQPIGFFAPKAGYAVGDAVEATFELKAMIKELHRAGIEVILDIVLNHTAEGNEHGPVISYKGIDLPIYYMLTHGYFQNFSGTGNAFSGNHPAVISHLLDCLRYWVTEYHVDGFRFDLASVLTRAPDGTPLDDPPLIRLISNDPVLYRTKLIAEPWDVGGLYQVGNFPAYGRWSEWNGRYRDSLRRFLKGDPHMVGEMCDAVQGYPDMYRDRGPIASINMITAHDGFTLHDLVSYNQKHNDQDDGHDANFSYNYGVEGPTDDPEILEIRHRQMKNALAILFTSMGVPMIMMGDEIARTQNGNNNAYRQDSEISWFNWNLIDENGDLFRFMQQMIAFRKAHPALRPRTFHSFIAPKKGALAPMSLHGVKAGTVDFGAESRAFTFLLSGRPETKDQLSDDVIYVAMNMSLADLKFELPKIPSNLHWYLFANTGTDEIYEIGREPILGNQKTLPLLSRSVAILVGR